jgi:cyclic pyranopterin phosphate synthase
VVSEQDILSILEKEFKITAIAQDHEPAKQFAIQNLNDAIKENFSKQTYRIGIISTISNPFCQQCDRLRLTATGELFTCLFSDQGLSFKDKLEQYQKNKDDTLRNEIIDTIKTVVWYKDAGYVSKQRAPLRKISMHAIGG